MKKDNKDILVAVRINRIIENDLIYLQSVLSKSKSEIIRQLIGQETYYIKRILEDEENNI